jgi:hypothetical protein
MRTPYQGLRMACDLLAEIAPDKYPLEYARRREVLQAINFTLGVKTVLDGCSKGHNDLYVAKIERYLTECPEYADITSRRNRNQKE